MTLWNNLPQNTKVKKAPISERGSLSIKPPLWNTPRGYHRLGLFHVLSALNSPISVAHKRQKEKIWFLKRHSALLCHQCSGRSGNLLPVLVFGREANRSARVTNIFKREFRNLSLECFCKTIRKSNWADHQLPFCPVMIRLHATFSPVNPAPPNSQDESPGNGWTKVFLNPALTDSFLLKIPK